MSEVESDAFSDCLPLTAVRIAPGEYEVKARDGRILWRMNGAALADWVCASVNGYDAAINALTVMRNFREARWRRPKDVEAVMAKHFAAATAALDRLALLAAFRDTAIKAHIGFKHEGPWEKCEWIECEDRRKMIEGADVSPVPAIRQAAKAIASGLDRPDAVEWIEKVIKQYHSRQFIEEQTP